MVIALIALVFSTTGLADAARHAVISAIAGHPCQHPAARRRRCCCSARTASSRRRRSRRSRTPASSAARRPPDRRHLPARHRRPRHLVSGHRRPIPLTEGKSSAKNNFIWASTTCEAEGGWLPSGVRSCVEQPPTASSSESTIHDSPLTRHPINRVDPSRGLKGRTQEMELDAHHHRSGIRGGRLRGGQRRRDRRSAPGPGQPDPLAGQPVPRIAPVRDRVRQRQPGGLRGLAAGERTAELPLRVQQDARRAEQKDRILRSAWVSWWPSKRPICSPARPAWHRMAFVGARGSRCRSSRVLAAARRIPAGADAVILPAVTDRRRSERRKIVGFGGVGDGLVKTGTGGTRLPQARRKASPHVFVSGATLRATGWRRSASTPKQPVRRQLAADRRRRTAVSWWLCGRRRSPPRRASRCTSCSAPIARPGRLAVFGPADDRRSQRPRRHRHEVRRPGGELDRSGRRRLPRSQPSVEGERLERSPLLRPGDVVEASARRALRRRALVGAGCDQSRPRRLDAPTHPEPTLRRSRSGPPGKGIVVWQEPEIERHRPHLGAAPVWEHARLRVAGQRLHLSTAQAITTDRRAERRDLTARAGRGGISPERGVRPAAARTTDLPQHPALDGEAKNGAEFEGANVARQSAVSGGPRRSVGRAERSTSTNSTSDAAAV